MKDQSKRKKKRFWKPVTIGFATTYLMTMGLVTWLVKGRYVEEYKQSCTSLAASLLDSGADLEESARQEGWDEDEIFSNYLDLANAYFPTRNEPYVLFSAAFYDKEKKLLAKSSDVIDGVSSNSSAGETRKSFLLDDFLLYEEKEELAGYYWEALHERMESEEILPEKYRISVQCSPDGQKLLGIYVQQSTWEEGPGEPPYYENPLDGASASYTMIEFSDSTVKEIGESKSFHETDSQIVWQWTNPDFSDEQRKEGLIQGSVLYFPYVSTSYKNWQQWNRSKYLQDFPSEGSFERERGSECSLPSFQTETDNFCYRGRFSAPVGMLNDPRFYLEIRIEARPWLASMNYMKYIYLAGFVLTFACMAVIIYTLNRTYEQQMLLEETRRDFTNAMAHELKTPLGIIRNFAENLFEHNMEEKRDYYISQIIGQTEEMDQLVAQMIEVSKLDSEKMVLKKEPVSFSKLIHQQAERFEPMICEKNLLLRYEEKADFQVEGDMEYLAKAVWNLLSNAVDYNVADGTILIKIDSSFCTIENSGSPLDEEQLAHAFDLLYTSNKSRGGKEKHMGMGLFLAKRILELHHLNLALENTDEGIRAVIQR